MENVECIVVFYKKKLSDDVSQSAILFSLLHSSSSSTRLNWSKWFLERILSSTHAHRVIPRLHDTTGLTTGLTTGCIHDTASCQTGCQTGLTIGWMFVYTIQPVDNRLYRVYKHLPGCQTFELAL